MVKIPETATNVYYELLVDDSRIGFRDGKIYVPYGWLIDGNRRGEGWQELVDGMRFTTRTGNEYLYNQATGLLDSSGSKTTSYADMLNKIAQVASGSLIERVGGEVFLLLREKRVKLGCTQAIEMIRANNGSMKVEFNSDDRSIWTLEKAPVFTGDHSDNATTILSVYREVCDGK